MVPLVRFVLPVGTPQVNVYGGVPPNTLQNKVRFSMVGGLAATNTITVCMQKKKHEHIQPFLTLKNCSHTLPSGYCAHCT